MSYLAICTPAGGSARTLGIMLPLAGLVVYAFVFWWLALRETTGESHPGLVVVWFLAGAIGALIASTPGGLSDSDADYFGRFIGGLVVGGGVGVVWALWVGTTQTWRYVVMGLLGGGTFLAGALGLLIFSLTASNSCLG